MLGYKYVLADAQREFDAKLDKLSENSQIEVKIFKILDSEK